MPLMGSDMSFLAAESSGSGAFNLLLFLAIPLVFYFMLIRPQSKRRREQLQMQNNIQPGVRVITTSGMYGTVVALDDDGLLLEVAPGVELRFVKAAVMNIVADDAETERDDELDDEHDVLDGGAADRTDDTEDSVPEEKVELSKGEGKADRA
jgi:preprotein translocase subunit YajC